MTGDPSEQKGVYAPGDFPVLTGLYSLVLRECLLMQFSSLEVYHPNVMDFLDF